MKNLVFVAVLIFLGWSIFAEAQTRITDLNYKPQLFESYLFLSATWSDSSSALKLNSATGSRDISKSSYGLLYAYSLSENGTIGINLAQSTTEVEYSVEGINLAYKSEGLNDPDLLYRHRFVTEGSPYLGDLMLSFTPSTQKAKQATLTKNGNEANGGHKAGVEVAIGQETGQFGARLALGAEYLFKSESTDQSTNTKDTADAYLITSAKLRGQIKLSPQFAVSAGVSYLYLPKRKSKDVVGTRTELDSVDITGLEFTVAVNPKENLHIDFGLGFQKTGGYNDTTDGTIVEFTDIKNSSFLIGVGHSF